MELIRDYKEKNSRLFRQFETKRNAINIIAHYFSTKACFLQTNFKVIFVIRFMVLISYASITYLLHKRVYSDDWQSYLKYDYLKYDIKNDT